MINNVKIYNSERKEILLDNAVNSKEIFSQYMISRFVSFLDVAPITIKSYKAGIKTFLTYLRNNAITQPTRENILDFKNNLTESGHKPATVALYLSAVRRFFSWAESLNIYPNITLGVKAPKIDKGHKKDFFSGEQVKQILHGISRANIEGLRNYAIFALMINCGLRTVEITRANVDDMRTIGGYSVLFIQGKGKTSKADFVKLSPQVERAIRAYLKARGQVRPDSPLFVSHSRRNSGQRLTTRTISGVCKNAMIQAGFNSARLTAHSLRHSAVTLALLAGLTLSEVQAFARHSNIATTQIYAHNIDRLKSTCESVISNAIFD